MGEEQKTKVRGVSVWSDGPFVVVENRRRVLMLTGEMIHKVDTFEYDASDGYAHGTRPRMLWAVHVYERGTGPSIWSDDHLDQDDARRLQNALMRASIEAGGWRRR